ncbi:MAG: serine/threonine protein kinase [Myxococcales bacterium]|nr:serine/threonine protein kinase [Myxococcales bacterium]
MTTSNEERFGPYVLTRRIAMGGMGELFLARRRGVGGFEKQVVVKRILPDLARDPQLVQMFLDEARVSALLDHANIVHIYELGEVDGAYFLAMEYVDGRDLRQVLQRHDGPLELGCALTILGGICEGLAYAHEARDVRGRPLELVHRDLSPHNVLVSYSGAVKLTDFGIAKVSQRVTRTQVGVLKGKLGYLSPEQARSEPIDQRSDIYSLGLLLFEATTGAPAVSSGSDSGYIRAARRGETRTPEHVLPGYPAPLAAIFARATERDRERRYRNVREMRRAILDVQTKLDLLRTQRDVSALMRELFSSDDEPSGADEPVVPTEVVYGQTPLPQSALETADRPPLRVPPPLGAGGTARRPRKRIEVVSASAAGIGAAVSLRGSVSGAYDTDALQGRQTPAMQPSDTDPDSVPSAARHDAAALARAPRVKTMVLEEPASQAPMRVAAIPTVLVPEELDSALLRRTSVFSEEHDTEPVTDVHDPTRTTDKDDPTVLVGALRHAVVPPAVARHGDALDGAETQVRDEPETLLEPLHARVSDELEEAQTYVRDDAQPFVAGLLAEEDSTEPQTLAIAHERMTTRPLKREAVPVETGETDTERRPLRARAAAVAPMPAPTPPPKEARPRRSLHAQRTQLKAPDAEQRPVSRAAEEPRPVRPSVVGQRRVLLWLVLTAVAVGMTAGLVIVGVSRTGRRRAGAGDGTSSSSSNIGGAAVSRDAVTRSVADAGVAPQSAALDTSAATTAADDDARAGTASADAASASAGSAAGSASGSGAGAARNRRPRRRVARGRAMIEATPRLSVTLGRRALGATPLRIKLPVGRHTLLLRHRALGLELRRVLRVRRRGTATLRVRLPPGKLQIKARPWARVSVDGKGYGITPIRPIVLSPGVHRVRLSNKRHGSVERAVKVFPGRTARLVHVF